MACRRIAVCVDDYGLNEAVNAGALELVELGRVSALACLTRAAAWQPGARALRALKTGRCDVGLHLNLSERFGDGQWHQPLAALCMGAYTRCLPQARVRAEIAAQFAAFEHDMGRAPDFVDGHQHVHQLPVVRELLMQELVKRYPARRPWLRNTQAPQALRSLSGKQRVIAALGSRAFCRLAGKLGYPLNRSLLGVYGFSGSLAAHTQRLAAWCDAAEDGSVLMTHVANAVADGDPIARARLTEYEALRSASFGAQIGPNLAVVRLSETFQPPSIRPA